MILRMSNSFGFLACPIRRRPAVCTRVAAGNVVGRRYKGLKSASGILPIELHKMRFVAADGAITTD
jgi:hypothetical protein